MSTPPADERQQAIDTMKAGLLAADPTVSEEDATGMATALVDEAIRRRGGTA